MNEFAISTTPVVAGDFSGQILSTTASISVNAGGNYAINLAGETSKLIIVLEQSKSENDDDDDEVTHEVFFGENIRRVIKHFKK